MLSNEKRDKKKAFININKIYILLIFIKLKIGVRKIMFTKDEGRKMNEVSRMMWSLFG
jgi:hypothetical protein